MHCNTDLHLGCSCILTLRDHGCTTVGCHTSAKSQAWSLAPSSSHCFCSKQKAKVNGRHTYIFTHKESSMHANNSTFNCHSIKPMHLHQKRQCKTQYASHTHTPFCFLFLSALIGPKTVFTQDATGVGFPVSLLLPCSALSTSMILAYLRGDTF